MLRPLLSLACLLLSLKKTSCCRHFSCIIIVAAMEEKTSRATLKRSLPDDDDGLNKPMQKRVRFPKGKKVKPGNEKVEVWKESDEDIAERKEASRAAKERVMRRNQIAADLFVEENRGMLPDISAAEVHYRDEDTFDDEGIQIEPFNLEKEREEGYFDEQGNYVEYVNESEIKDAWLDSAEVDQKLADKGFRSESNEDDIRELSSEEIAKIKRRIADVLEPGETVLRALRRLKGTPNSKKEKMSTLTKQLFDQLTDDAMKLMEAGDYNVYDEKREVFERESEGYEKLMRAKKEGIYNPSQEKSPLPSETGTSSLGGSAIQNVPNYDDAFDMFADDEMDTGERILENGDMVSGPNNIGIDAQSSERGTENDYVFDESSGYYYSSSLGYYYDPSSGLYCSAVSGQWYSYNEASGSYDEVQEVAPSAS